MTVTYTSEVATCKGLGGCFLKLLARWKGSIYKIVWSDLILYLFIYYTLNLSYVYIMDETTKSYFEDIVKYFSQYASLIPLSFVLGFYVDLVMNRWWKQYTSIAYPDNIAILVGAGVKGQDVRSRAVKRTIVRYCCTTFTMTLTMISPKVKKRFPTLDHFVEAGLLTKEEKRIIEELDVEYPIYSKYWLPLAWAARIIISSREEGLITDDECVERILENLNEFRNKCAGLLDYDWISVPLVYTQVVTIATYSYFLSSVIGNQHIKNEHRNIISSYFPLIPVLEFFFYMGWLKVAETLTNPFGEDDDDFDVMWMIDRHLQVVYLLVDKIPQKMPKLTRDVHWEETVPFSLPFTKASQNYNRNCPLSSTDKIIMSNSEQEIIPQPTRDSTGKRRSLLRSDTIFLRCTTPVLKSVVTGDNDNSNNDIDELDESLSRNEVYEVSDTNYELFEKLRIQRMEEQHERLRKIFKSLKEHMK